MLMFHGSYTKIIHPDIKYSRNNLDFGKGFYLAKDHDQAEKWALRFMKQKQDCVVNVYDVNLDYSEKNSQCIRNQDILNAAVQFCGSEVIKYGSE